MNTFYEISLKLTKIDSLFFTLETILNSNDTESRMAFGNSFYVLWDLIKDVSKDIDTLVGHSKVCSAIDAVNNVDDLRAKVKDLETENEALKKYIVDNVKK